MRRSATNCDFKRHFLGSNKFDFMENGEKYLRSKKLIHILLGFREEDEIIVQAQFLCVLIKAALPLKNGLPFCSMGIDHCFLVNHLH
jgi:hypothetical protein